MTDLTPKLVNRDWLDEPALVRLLSILNTAEEETRIVGGPVRNALLGEPISDIDCATTATPDITTALSIAAGFKVIPTGIEHGTVTVVVDEMPFEVTTLREDITTDGRHAKVKFGRDWTRDAERRDFTMNALSIDIHGEIHDPIGGYVDLINREVKFIGDPDKRIREDYLRILRYFRFFAWYGGGRPDREAMKAIVRNRIGIESLSVERIWQELKKIYAAPDPQRALLWMRTSEALDISIPEHWGFDQFHWMIEAEKQANWSGDPFLRLQAMLRPALEITGNLAIRLKFSNAERQRLDDWAAINDQSKSLAESTLSAFSQSLYWMEPQAISDVLKHEYAKRLAKEEDGADRILSLLDYLANWEQPAFPLKGSDLIERGLEAGKGLGDMLERLESLWVESGFTLDKAALLAKI